jgi:hypothetical protein
MFDVNEVPENIRKDFKPMESCYMSITEVGVSAHVILSNYQLSDKITIDEASPFYWKNAEPESKNSKDDLSLAQIMFVVFSQSVSSAIYTLSTEDIYDLYLWHYGSKNYSVVSALFRAMYFKAKGKEIVIMFTKSERNNENLKNNAVSWIDMEMDDYYDPFRQKEEKHGSVTNP